MKTIRILSVLFCVLYFTSVHAHESAFALVAALFGFGGIAAGAPATAKVIFCIFIVLFLLSLIAGGIRGFK